MLLAAQRRNKHTALLTRQIMSQLDASIEEAELKKLYASVVFGSSGNALVSLAVWPDTLPLAQCFITHQSGILGMANEKDGIIMSVGRVFPTCLLACLAHVGKMAVHQCAVLCCAVA